MTWRALWLSGPTVSYAATEQPAASHAQQLEGGCCVICLSGTRVGRQIFAEQRRLGFVSKPMLTRPGHCLA